ncbi:unnamed protein product [Bemisia tabaci]|uniref:von Hippel-Lindau disease tumour suppressor beta domain-containing protein n=1 Tax=Bemisia tabaci TaxID=7038 RepID=A0A9P0A9I0_BEMTA|nr:PREDICTED: von Hippel-Lindau disease tumor suppressor-like [Bemisia tabaci]CAH0387644.1 unnamed protein product [Bemisia tabaci]
MSHPATPIKHRSQHNGDRSFIRFINKTNDEVCVIWLDFDGNPVPFAYLITKGAFVDIDTYENHPWMFENPNNGDRFVVEKSEVYFPVSWKTEYRKMNRPQRGCSRQPIQRKNLLITYPVDSLKDRALRVIRNVLEKPEDSFKLDIPHSIQADVYKLMLKKSRNRNQATQDSRS